jgi:hypothetical protein
MQGDRCPQCHAVFQPTFTLKLLQAVQQLMFRAAQLRAPALFNRCERAERYLIERYSRDTPEEREVLDLIWPEVELGGEA